MKAFLILISLLASTLSWAEDDTSEVKEARWYQVNLTLFQQKPDTHLDESFEFTPLPLDMADIVELKGNKPFSLANTDMNATLAFHHENANNIALTEQTIDQDWADKMSHLDPIKQPIIFNAQWQQAVYEQQHSLPIYFQSSQQHLGRSQLNGLFYLHVSRYLHSKIDIQYLPNNADSTTDLISFQQSRRMRSKEVHYLDHPLVGAIIRILPVEHPLKRIKKEENTDLPDSALDSALNVRL